MATKDTEKKGAGRYLKDATGYVYGWNKDMALHKDLYTECDAEGTEVDPPEDEAEEKPQVGVAVRKGEPTKLAQDPTEEVKNQPPANPKPADQTGTAAPAPPKPPAPTAPSNASGSGAGSGAKPKG